MFDFATFERSSKPNDYLVAPQGLCQQAVPDADAPVFRQSADAVFLNLRGLVKADPQYKNVLINDAQLELSAIAVTKVFRFKDDVNVAVLPEGEGSTLAIYSRSRVGHADFGKNRQRIEALIAALQKEIRIAEGRVA